MEVKERIESRLTHLKPILDAGGRSIEVVSVEGGTITIKLEGFCSGCACSSSYKEGLQDLVQETCPELTEVTFIE